MARSKYYYIGFTIGKASKYMARKLVIEHVGVNTYFVLDAAIKVARYAAPRYKRIVLDQTQIFNDAIDAVFEAY